MLVSTVIPTYNRAKDVVIAVESALAQTYPADQHEILVVDDGSKDDTAQVLARTFGDRIRYLPKPNGGVSSARNFGIEQARGEAVAFLDSDDEWYPDKIAAQVDVLRSRPDIAMVLTDIMVMGPDRQDRAVYSRRSVLPEDGRVLRYVLRNPSMTPSTAMIRTAVAREVGGFDTTLRTAEDLDFHLRVALHHGIAVVARPLIRYMRNDDGLGAEMCTYHDYVKVMERFIREYGDQIPAEDARASLFGTYMRNARGLARDGDVPSGVRLGIKSLRLMNKTGDVIDVGGLFVTIGRTLASRTVKRFTGR